MHLLQGFVVSRVFLCVAAAECVCNFLRQCDSQQSGIAMIGYEMLCFLQKLSTKVWKICTNYCLPARPKPWTCAQFQPRIQTQAPRTHRYGAPHNPQLSSRPLAYHLPPDPSAAGIGSALFPQSEGASRPGSHNLPEEDLLPPATLLLLLKQ